MILLGSLVQVKGFGFALVWSRKRWMASLQFLERAKHAALKALFGELGKEALNGVEPGGRCRSEVEHEPGMVFDPFKNFGMLMSGIVIDDHMNRFHLGHPGIDDIEEADELLMAMTLHALAEDLALKDIERRE